MKIVLEIVQLLQRSDVPPTDWNAVLGLAYVMAGMTSMEHANAPGGRERAREALLSVLDEVRGALQDWTPDVDIATQLAARFSGKLTAES